ncbi:hypothetical protein ACFL0L_05315, partial [Patescibacteria group bacterium]
VVPTTMRTFMEQQVHAQHPRAQIEEISDYNLFTPQSVITATNLVFRKPYIFPIKTYKELDVDPLNAVTNAMSKVPDGEGIAIQIVGRSAKASWHSWGVPPCFRNSQNLFNTFSLVIFMQLLLGNRDT